MGRKYFCSKCNETHEAPVGDKCEENISSKGEEDGDQPSGSQPSTSMETTATSGPTGIAKIMEALGSIATRLEKLEKANDGPKKNGGKEDASKAAKVPDSVRVHVVEDDSLSTAGKTLNALLNPSNIAGDAASPHVKHDRDRFDPRSMLTVKARRIKAVHITQFLHEGAKRRRQNLGRNVVVDTGSGNQDIVVGLQSNEHPYAHISIAEWGAANCRLMNYLLQEGHLKRPDIEYYLAYSAKIYDLAEKYEWYSILQYDYEYRELQSEHGFNWGVSNPHLELQVLVPRKVANTRNPLKPSTFKKDPIDTANEECKLMLAHGYCRFGDKCRYKHRPTVPPTDINAKK